MFSGTPGRVMAKARRIRWAFKRSRESFEVRALRQPGTLIVPAQGVSTQEAWRARAAAHSASKTADRWGRARASRESKQPRMRPPIASLDSLSETEARSYLEFAAGDEVLAALELAIERNRLDGSSATPDEMDVHHALFMIRRVFGRGAPSFDTLRVALRRLLAA